MCSPRMVMAAGDGDGDEWQQQQNRRYIVWLVWCGRRGATYTNNDNNITKFNQILFFRCQNALLLYHPHHGIALYSPGLK